MSQGLKVADYCNIFLFRICESTVILSYFDILIAHFMYIVPALSLLEVYC